MTKQQILSQRRTTSNGVSGQNGDQGLKAKINILAKIMCTFTSMASILGFGIFSLYFIIFLQDISISDAFPTLNTNKKFNICEKHEILSQMCNISESITRIMFNLALILGFWSQHYIMSTNWFKKATISIFPEYIFIERSMFNLSSELAGLVMMNYYQPLDFFEIQLPNIVYIPFALIVIGGTCMLFKSALSMGADDIFGLNFMKQLWSRGNHKFLSFKERYEEKDSKNLQISNKSLYSLCRHPQQSGTIMIIFFTGLRWTLNRFVFCFVMFFGILHGVKREESKLLKNCNSQYTQYMEQVQSRFIPNFQHYNSLPPIQEKQQQSEQSEQKSK